MSGPTIKTERCDRCGGTTTWLAMSDGETARHTCPAEPVTLAAAMRPAVDRLIDRISSDEETR